MAKKSSIEKNNRRKKTVARYQEKRAELKSQLRNKSLPMNERMKLQTELSCLPRDSSPIRVRNRCALTGRPRGYYRKFDMSRICLRELARSGLLPGVSHGSW